MEIIGKSPEINVTEIAKRKGVTKGAVSQIVKKLEKKKLIKKFKAPENDKSVFIKLTKKGRIAYENHELFHDKYDSKMIEKLKKMNYEQLILITKTFEILEETIDLYFNDLRYFLFVYG